MGYDPSGHWNWRTVLDFVVTAVATIAGSIAAKTAKAKARITGKSKKSATVAGIAVGVATFGAVNNAANTFYYNHISEGKSNLETSSVDLPYEEKKSDYVNGYINRWDRLDYTKHVTKSETYDMNAWRFQSEYALHMHLWNIVEPFQGKGIWLADRIGTSAIHAHVDPSAPDPDWKIQVMTTFVGILGL